MGAVDRGLVRQGGQALQAGPHLLGRALEQPPAAQREQGVADEGDPVGRVEVGDVAQRVAAGLDHVEAGLAQLDDIAVAHRAVQRRDPRDLRRADDHAAGGGLDLGVAAGVVGMPVGVEDEVQAPAQLPQFSQDRVGVRRVDGRRLAASPRRG